MIQKIEKIFRKLNASFSYIHDNEKDNLFKIVDDNGIDTFTFKYEGFWPTFKLTIIEASNDIGLIDGLSSEEACFLGVCYSLHSKTHNFNSGLNLLLSKRDGKNYYIQSILRKGLISIFDIKNSQNIIDDPRDIILKKELIENISSSQAFHLGYLAAEKAKIMALRNNQPVPKRPKLYLVK